MLAFAAGGPKIGFSPAAFVWHYRRSTVRAYLKQQRGYGEAEALLVRKHPEYFNSLGGSIWRGRIYTTSRCQDLLRPPMIYRGPFGTQGFQSLYASHPAFNLIGCTTLEYHALVTVPSGFSRSFSIACCRWPSLASLSPLGSACQRGRNRHCRDKDALVVAAPSGTAGFLQPISAAGHVTRAASAALRRWPRSKRWIPWRCAIAGIRCAKSHTGPNTDSTGRLRCCILRRLDQQGWPNKADIGWSDYDIEVAGSRWTNIQLTTVSEDHPRGKQLIRCRLRPAGPSEPISFWALSGFELLLCGLAGPRCHWLWPILLALPLFVWSGRREQRNFRVF